MGDNNIIKQESLQPKRLDPKQDKAYQSVLDIAERLQVGDATNIALTGPYGSGKSSILISLKDDYPQFEYLNISLATLQAFDNNDSDNLKGAGPEEPDEEISKNNLDRLIEYSILQQIIYREKQNTLPNSRLKRIFHLSGNDVKYIASSTLLAFLAVIIVFEPSALCVGWLCKLFGYPLLNIIGDVLSLGYLTWYAYTALKKIVPAISNSRLNKFNLKSGDIEIVKNTSIFNKHLDEILYFFEMTKYNVVIIEDLDRFGSTAIFLKLRELNLLLNESKVIDRRIFFVYAVRDDMFKDAERVKCFDYITTVIPVINRSNAKNQLKEELEKRGVTEMKDKDLRELGFFLNDMRLLKNITNEYVQYREKLAKGISCEKLLAMIIYKNYYPQDFAHLHDCKGIVYQLINMKETFVSEQVVKIEEENKKKIELREKHLKEKHLKEAELRRIYLEAYRDKIGNNIQKIKVGDNLKDISEIAISEPLFDKLISSKTVTYSYLANNGYSQRIVQNAINLPFQEIEKTVYPLMSYKERLESLRVELNKLDDRDVIEIKIEDIRSQALSQIMTDVDYTKVPKYNALNVPKLIEYLVVKGYIDENYYDYISYFYNNFIDAHDWEFVLDVKLGKAHEYDYIINNVEACLTEIPNSAYRKAAILNTFIVDCIALKQYDRMNVRRLLVILKTVVDNKKYDFLIAYYLKGHRPDVVFGALFSQYKDIWNDFEKFDDNELHLRQIWYRYAEINNSNEMTQDWISDHFDFIIDHLSAFGEEHWCSLIEKNPYHFKTLNSTSEKILDSVEKRDAFELNKNNVATLISCFLKHEYMSASYKLVLESERQKLIKKVEDDLDTCLKKVFSQPESSKESFDSIIKILNNEEVIEQDKIAYLKFQEDKLDFVDFDTDDIKNLAIKCDVVEPIWENVIDYMNNVSDKKADNDLVNYIERHTDELSQLKVPQENEADERMLLRQIIETNVLTFDSYARILERFTRWNFNTWVPVIEENRFILLVEKGMVHFSKENTVDISGKYSSKALVRYLIKNKSDFLMNAETIDYTTEVAQGILESDLTVKEKSQIIPYIKLEILNGTIANHIVSMFGEINLNVGVDFMLKVLQLSTLMIEKVLVINKTLDRSDLDENRITSLIKKLPAPYCYIAEKGKKPEIPNNEQSKKLVELLKKKNYISTFSENNKGIRVNTKLK